MKNKEYNSFNEAVSDDNKIDISDEDTLYLGKIISKKNKKIIPIAQHEEIEIRINVKKIYHKHILNNFQKGLDYFMIDSDKKYFKDFEISKL